MSPSQLEYLEHLEGLGKTEKYIAQVKSVLKRFATPVARAQHNLNRYAADHSDGSVAYVVGVLKAYGRWAGVDSLKALEKPAARTGRTLEHGTIEGHEVDALCSDERIPLWRRELYRVASATGLRPVEIRRLAPGHAIRRPDGRWELRLPAGSQKARRGDVLPIREEVAQLIRERAPWTLSEWTWNSLASALRGDLRLLGLPESDYAGRKRTFYSLRGHFADRLLSSGVPVHVAQRLMRHANVQTTLKHYAKPSDAALFAAVEGLA